MSIIITTISVVNPAAYTSNATTTSVLHFSILSPQSVQSNLLGSQDVVRSYSVSNLSNYPGLIKAILFFEVTDCNPPNGHDLSSAISTAQSFPFTSNDYVGYDPELSNGNFTTCSSELQQMPYYTSLAANTTHAAGYLFLLDPGWYHIEDNYQAIDWTKVDMLSIQAQNHTSDSTFISTITSEATFVHSQNPKTRIYIQVDPAFDTISNIVNAINSVRSQLFGVSIICNTNQGCNTTMLNQLITQLNTLPLSVSITAPSSGTTGTLINLNSVVSGGSAPYTYSWAMTVPAGSTATLSSSTSANPTFTPDVAGSYTLGLTVTDSLGNQASAQQATITVTKPSAASTTLTLNPITSVPWGTNVVVSGKLTATGTGAGVGAKTITFSGIGAAGLSSVTTNPDGTFTAAGPAPSTVATGWQVNANFAGDSSYDPSSSTQSYNTIKRSPSLTLVISPSSVLHGSTYSVSGTLTDKTTGAPLSSITISFTATSPITIPNTSTDSNGKYLVSGLTAPSTVGSYGITAKFSGSILYKAYSITKTLTVS